VLLLIFIVQNDRIAGTSYLGVHGHIPLGVAPLPTAIFGVILVVLCGTATIIQLRIAAHHHRRAGARATPPRRKGRRVRPATGTGLMRCR
jgi:uncharacterized integral membrane protein